MGFEIVLGALFVGLLGVGAWGVWVGFSDRDAFPLGMGAVLITITIGFALASYERANDPSPRIVLFEREWSCTDTETYMAPVLVGKITTMQPRRRCIQYSRGSN